MMNLAGCLLPTAKGTLVKNVLRSKITPPRLRHETVLRGALLARLDQGVGGRLILVCAPAGYGKSTLVADWIAERKEQFYASWLSLESEDNDLNRLAVHLAAAVGAATPQLLALLEDSLGLAEGNGGAQSAGGEALVQLLNALAELDKPLLIVLDDYHLITHFEIHRMMLALLTHLPDTVTVVMITRMDPPLPLARLQSQGVVAALRAADLRFDACEAMDFMNGGMGLSLTEEQVAGLTTRTEGWVTGLKLAGLSLLQHDNVQRFLEEFAGDNHNIRSYLMDEALAGQPPEVQRFLLATSILDRLCAPLCEAVLGEGGGFVRSSAGQRSQMTAQDMLEYLERHNLFITPLDEHGQWYRYHTLFGELLRFQLWRDHQAQVSIYQRRAGEWLAEHGLIKEMRRTAGAWDGHAFARGPASRPGAGRASQGDGSPLLEELSEREKDVLEQLANDLSYQEIAERLFISLPTVKTHIAHIYSKLGVHSRDEAIEQAVGYGLLT